MRAVHRPLNMQGILQRRKLFVIPLSPELDIPMLLVKILSGPAGNAAPMTGNAVPMKSICFSIFLFADIVHSNLAFQKLQHFSLRTCVTNKARILGDNNDSLVASSCVALHPLRGGIEDEPVVDAPFYLQLTKHLMDRALL
jgi:hypothetical protein